MLRCLIVFLFYPVFCLNQAMAQEDTVTTVLTPSAMQQDFSYLRKTLEETHPGLYKHQPKDVMQHKMDSLYEVVNKPMNFYRFYGIVASLIADVKCEHTSCSPYPNSLFQAKIQQYKMVPMVIVFINNKGYVAINLTSDTTIHLGDEVCTINQHPMDSVEHALFKYIPSDGDIETSKEQMLSNNMAFNVWYYFFIERPESFDIVFREPNGRLKKRHFADELTLKENEKNLKSNPVNRQLLAFEERNKKELANPWRIQLIKEKQAAILTVRSFSGDKKKMYAAFAQYFKELQKEKVANLIIDLGYNPGGDEAAAAELFSYLISSPTKFMNEEYLITDNNEYLKLADLPLEVLNHKEKYLQPEKDGKFLVKEETQGELPLVRPKPTHFNGKIYFYINGGTASAASTFAAVAQSNHLGIFIGEETGGAYFGGGSSLGLNLTLPYSGITVHSSINYCIFASSGKHDPNRGVIPDYHFVPTLTEILSGNSSWQDYVLELIDKNK